MSLWSLFYSAQNGFSVSFYKNDRLPFLLGLLYNSLTEHNRRESDTPWTPAFYSRFHQEVFKWTVARDRDELTGSVWVHNKQRRPSGPLKHFLVLQ
jgi:hypothetical protein